MVRRLVVPLTACVLLTGCASAPSAEDSPAPSPVVPTNGATPAPGSAAPLRQAATVRYVYDGDTIQVALAGKRVIRVRLIGVDTPEVHGTVECGGPEATALTRRLLPAGTPVVLLTDPTQDRFDRYGRRLRYVAKGEQDIDKVLVRRGAGRVYVYGRTPFTRVSAYRAAEAKARQERRGLWGSCPE